MNKSHQAQISQITDELNHLKKLIFALKEKSPEAQIFDFNDFDEGPFIGEGGTSNVRIVTKKEETKKNTYAMKVLKNCDHKTFQRFFSEGEILYKLFHPCIVRIHGFNYGDSTHLPSIFLSHEPSSLEDAINAKVLNEREKSMIAVEIVLGMRYIHKRGFIHRDLKPSNILLSKDKKVRISDFGLAREDNTESSFSKNVGTIRFMAPEIFEDEDEKEKDKRAKYTNKVDVYSFGPTFAFIVNDAYPKFSIRNTIDTAIASLPESMTKWTRELVVRCMSDAPDERPSFAEIFEIMKKNGYDLFGDEKTSSQKNLKDEIEKRVLEIEAFEYQHQND